MTKRKSLFMFLMALAWRCRFSMPLLLSGTVALLGQAWMFQIRVHTVHHARDATPDYYLESSESEEDDMSTIASSTDSWETTFEEVSYG